MTHVQVFAKEFHGGPIAGASVFDMETWREWKTGADGYVSIPAAPGQQLTLLFNHKSYPAVQTGTVTVPKEGMTGDNHEVTFEVPSETLYETLLLAFGAPKPGTRHVVTTVLAKGSNIHNNIGEPGAFAYLVGANGEKIEGAYIAAKVTDAEGEGGHTTSWPSIIARRVIERLGSERFGWLVGEKRTTIDGGVLFFDVPLGEYRLVAEKQGVVFSEAHVKVTGWSPRLINAGPPQGPRAMG